MKPYVICHMNASVDGRILGSRWRPAENRMAGLFERLHEELGGGSWLIGRVTGSEYAKTASYPDRSDRTYPREPWFAQRSAPGDAGQSHLKALPLDGGGLGGGDHAASPVRSGCQAPNSPPPRPSPIKGEGVSRPNAIARPGDAAAPGIAYGIALDAQGKIAWGRSDIGGDAIVVVLTERVSDAHLAGLRQDGVSYIFAGDEKLDLGLALEILNRELGLERLLLEGGGGSNGAFLRAGLIDEISLAICPAIDGAKGAPSIFDSSDRDAGIAAPIRSMILASTEVLEGGVVWLRYRLQNG